MLFHRNSTCVLLISVFLLACSTLNGEKPIQLNELITIEGSNGRGVFSPDGKMLASSGPNYVVYLWDVDSGKKRLTMKGHTNGIWQMSFSPDGNRLACVQNWVLKVWDLNTGREIKSMEMPAFSRACVFSRDGKRIAVGNDDGRVRIWDVQTARVAKVLKGHSDWVPRLDYSPKGDRLATGSLDTTVKVWDLKSGKFVQSLEGHDWYVSCVAFGPKGKKVISGSDDKTARLWDIETGKLLFTLRGHDDWILDASISPDGKWLATSSHDKTAKLWDAISGKEIFTIRDHKNSVYSVRFSPSGNRLATASSDGTMKIWEIQSLAAQK